MRRHTMMSRFNILIATTLLCGCLSLAAMATEVDYDEVDEAALPMVAQTGQPQAADQFMRIYRQVLIFDENEYGGSYNLDMLEASLAAGAAVFVYDPYSGTDDYRWWAAEIGALGLYLLDYGTGTEKNATLTGLFGSLGRAWNRYWNATREAWNYIRWCIFGSPAANKMAEFAQVAQIVAGIIGMYPGYGQIISKGIMLGLLLAGTLLCVLCIVIGNFTFYQYLFLES